MLRIRKLVLAIAAASALSSGMAHALSLGELTLKSAQNQPLYAEIELLDVRDLTAAEIAPSLAPNEEFAKAGVERLGYLNDLTFTPVINPAGKSVLRVTSSQPLPAPMVKFLVQVMWPNGRLLRDYSVLIDQAKFSPQSAQAAAVTPAVTAPARYTTVRRDTLWEIAAKARQGGSVQQTMLAIQALNPDAFINGNINQLKTGQVLRLPDAQQIQSTPQPQAVKEVAEQYAAWREGRRLGPRARQLDATHRVKAQAAPARIVKQDNLRLVTPGAKGASGNKALADKLATTQETLDTSRRDNAELKERMADLQSQLDKLQRLIQLKNDQLARLEAQAAAAPEPVANAAPEQPVIAAQLQPAATNPVVTPAPAATDTAPVSVESQAAKTSLDDLLGNPLLLALIAGSALLVLLLLLLLLARKRKAQQEAEKHLRMARALAEESELGPDLDLPESSFEGLEVSAPSVKLAPAVVAASAAAATAAEQAPVEPAPKAVEPKPVEKAAPVVEDEPELVAEPEIVAEPVDPLLAEVDLSIARGRLNHAAELLEPAVEQAPQRSDLRLKLMEVYARQGDRDAFTGHERQLIATGQNHADVEALKSRFPAMVALAGGAAALAAELDAQYVKELLQDESPAEVAPQVPEDALDDAFDLSLDDLEGLDLADATVVEEAVVPELTEQVAAHTEDDLSFDSVLQEQLAAPQVPEPTPQPEPEPAAVPEVVVEAEPEPEPEPEPLDDLADFDLDVGDEPSPSVAQAPRDIEAELAAFDESLGLEADLPELSGLGDLDFPDDFDLSVSGDSDAASASFASELEDVNAELDKLSQGFELPPVAPRFTAEDAASLNDEPEFDYLAGTDEVATKLDLARAYIDMGDNEGARDILDEVVKEGDQEQRREASEMRSRLA
ncbi:FimV/HubP family polar landmark protein [Pseudomonas sp. HLS-6 TE3448]